jgi:hypothetical protein
MRKIEPLRRVVSVRHRTQRQSSFRTERINACGFDTMIGDTGRPLTPSVRQIMIIACGTQSVEQRSMKTIKTYSTRVDGDLARIALEAAGIPAVVLGVGVGMEGGLGGVQLLVPDDRVDEALTVLGDA